MMRDLSGANDKTKQTADYLEATVFSKDQAVIMIGNFADVKTEAEKKKVCFECSANNLKIYQNKLKINSVSRWYKPWWFKYVETFLEKGEADEYIPLEDYLLRHNRAIFWVLESMIPFANNVFFRYSNTIATTVSNNKRNWLIY